MVVRSTKPVTLRQVLSIIAASSIFGCAELNSIYRSEVARKDEALIVSIDAKQRVILSNPNTNKGKVEIQKSTEDRNGTETQRDTKTIYLNDVDLRFCAEPPPDVFTALASSLAAEASASKSATADSVIAAKLAATISENAATIERTQTINILRESMYRNCERYLSGAISKDEMIVQAARDQQLIVQVLAIEQITGASRAQATALTTVAKAAASGVTDTGLEILANAKKDFETKRAVSVKTAAAADELPPAGPCTPTPIDVEDLPDGVSKPQAEAKNSKCTEAKTATQLMNEAKNYLDTVQQAVARQAEVSSVAQGKLTSAAQNAVAASERIAKQVVEIVKQSNAFDEIGMTCVVIMRNRPEALPVYCKDLLAQMSRTSEARLAVIENIDQQKVDNYLNELKRITEEHANVVWNFLGEGENVQQRKNKLQQLVDEAGVVIPKVRFEKKDSLKDFNKFVEEFGRLDAATQKKLANATK